jgi:hypothetical protein
MWRFAVVPLFVLAVSASSAVSQDGPKDFTNVDPKTLGFVPFAPKRDDATGFVVGGKNATELIAKLPFLAGRTIKALEKDMRPGALSTKGFLGKDESLLEILANDNKFVVDTKGLTHQQLARPLHIVGAIADKHSKDEPYEFLYHGRKYKVSAIRFRGFVESPFEDGTKTNVAVNITNAKNGKTISTSLIVPHLIERYGFYEGKGTPYRLEPTDILDVFDFLTSEKKP